MIKFLKGFLSGIVAIIATRFVVEELLCELQCIVAVVLLMWCYWYYSCIKNRKYYDTKIHHLR